MDDRERWNERHRNANRQDAAPSRVIESAAKHLPRQGAALDLAGGLGRHAIWLARLGLTATLVDVSDVGLQIADARAELAGIPIQSIQRDLLQDGLPIGQWDVILSCLFLHRPLFEDLKKSLNPGGVFVMVQPTTENLTKHRRPPERYCLTPNELPSLITRAGLVVVEYREGWLEDGRHDAFIVAANRIHSDGNEFST